MQALSLLESKFNLKHLYRRIALFSRVLIVFTFLDDALRVATDYEGQVNTFYGLWGRSCAHLLPILSVVIQSTGVLLVLMSRQPQYGCCVLIVWTIVHPFMYAQQANLEFLLESVTICGGLLILLSSERAKLAQAYRTALPVDERHGVEVADGKALLLVGRMAVSAVFVYYVAKTMYERIWALEADSRVPWFTQASASIADGVLMVSLAVATGLIIVGMKSRWCAFLLAVVMVLAACYKHPWFIYMWSDKMFKLDVVVGDARGMQVEAWLYASHQRYFFFQQLSTAGALLQLVVHGPGTFSVDEAEGPITMEVLTAKGSD